MPRKPKKQFREKQRKGSPTSKQENLLRDYVRSEGVKYLNDPNINSVGIGYKVKDGRRTNQLAVQFTVDKKVDRLELESLSSAAIPQTVKWKGVEIPTDVIQRKFYPSFRIVKPEAKSERKRRLTTLVPGISVSHPKGTAGTLGLIVYDKQTGQPCMLSNWHVLNTPGGKLGDFVVQPGPFDDDRVDQNHAGRLLRSHLGLAGDCAIARIEDRLDVMHPLLQRGQPRGSQPIREPRPSSVEQDQPSERREPLVNPCGLRLVVLVGEIKPSL
jgi:endonuclease G